MRILSGSACAATANAATNTANAASFVAARAIRPLPSLTTITPLTVPAMISSDDSLVFLRTIERDPGVAHEDFRHRRVGLCRLLWRAASRRGRTRGDGPGAQSRAAAPQYPPLARSGTHRGRRRRAGDLSRRA